MNYTSTGRERPGLSQPAKLALLLPIGALLCAGCAMVHNTNHAVQLGHKGAVMGKRTQAGLVISGAEERAASSKHFGLINLTFENTTGRWIEVKDLKIGFGRQMANKNAKVVTGRALLAWSTATGQLVKIREHNTRMALLGAGLAGAAVGAAASGRSAAPPARAAVAMTGLASAAHELAGRAAAASDPRLVPESHLLAGDFLIPPGLFTKKFVVVYTAEARQTGYLTTLVLSYRTSSGARERVKLRFRKKDVRSEWQRELA